MHILRKLLADKMYMQETAWVQRLGWLPQPEPGSTGRAWLHSQSLASTATAWLPQPELGFLSQNLPLSATTKCPVLACFELGPCFHPPTEQTPLLCQMGETGVKQQLALAKLAQQQLARASLPVGRGGPKAVEQQPPPAVGLGGHTALGRTPPPQFAKLAAEELGRSPFPPANAVNCQMASVLRSQFVSKLLCMELGEVLGLDLF